MSYDAGENAIQKHLDWYEVEILYEEGPSSSAGQDAQATPAIEDFGELAPVVQYLRYGQDGQLNTSPYPTIDPNYPTNHQFSFIDPSVPRMHTASPNSVGTSLWSAQPCDGPQMSPQALIGDSFGDKEQIGNEIGYVYPGDSEWVGQRQSGILLNDEEVFVRDTHRRGGAHFSRRPLEEFELEDIKLKYAQGLSTAQIFENYPDHTVHDFENRFRGEWKRWTVEQDEELIRLHNEKGDDWFEISEEIPGVSRNIDEVRLRLEYLEKRDKDGGDQYRGSRGRHQYSQEQDNGLRRQLAEGISYGKLAEQSTFQHLRPWAIKRHAKIIGASWDEDDDEKLQENVMGYEDRGMNIDWGSIGKQYNPPRGAEFVEAHWGHIQARYNHMKESEMSADAGRQPQAEQYSQRQQYSGFYEQPSSQTYPGNPSQYPTADPSSSSSAAVTHSLEDVNTSSIPRYGSAYTMYLPDAPNEPAHPKPGSNGSYSAHKATAQYRRQLDANLDEIRTRLAKNWSWHQVQEKYCPGYRYGTMRKFLLSRNCSRWDRQQDQHLLALRRDGLDWAQVCDQLTDPQRTEAEAENRFAWLTKPDDNEEEDEEDDDDDE